MKRFVYFSLLFAVFYFTVPAFAIRLAGNQTELTANPLANPATDSETFDVSGQIATWIDSRDVNGVPRIYASLLYDDTHAEFGVDGNAPNVISVKTDGRYIVYPVWNESMQSLRIADMMDINNPDIKNIDMTSYDISQYEIDNGIVVYNVPGDSYLSIPTTIYAVSLSDPLLTMHIIKEFSDYQYCSNISIDGNRVVWSGEYYDDVNGIYSNYIDIADITDIANPVITRNFLPKHNDYEYTAWINSLVVCGDWLIARGSYNYNDGVFGIYNYDNPQAWQFSMIRQMQEYRDFSLRADEPYVVWVENDIQQPQGDMQTQSESGSENQSIIMAAVLFDNGKFSASVVKTNDDYWAIMGADVSGGKVIWGADYFYADSETETVEEYRDLFADTLELECGDKGYSLADLNSDCMVNFADFAMFAERWLVCTMPDDINCTDGEIFLPSAGR